MVGDHPDDVANDRLFYQKKTWQKLVVMAGGPAMNLLIAFVLFWGIIGLHGTWVAQPVVAEIQPCIITEDKPAGTTCTIPDTPPPSRASGPVTGSSSSTGSRSAATTSSST